MLRESAKTFPGLQSIHVIEMACHEEVPQAYCNEQKQTEMESNVDISNKISTGEEIVERGLKNKNFSNIIKRYPRYDLLSLRNAQLSIHYPHCALRSELQALSIWTCRLRCELLYLGLWKIPNTGNCYGNCSCNSGCQSYVCEPQSYSSSNSQMNTVNSQICSGNVQQSMQPPPLQTNSSPTLGSKKAMRSRERFLNYQRCINTELIRATSPNGGGESQIQHQVNHQIKPAFIDHRSISSSHLMPAFAKRRMHHVNALNFQSDIGLNLNSNDVHNTERSSNDDGGNQSSALFGSSVKSGKDSSKLVNNQSDYHLYKGSASSRLDKSDQLIDKPAGWINLVKKINSDMSSSNNKVNNTCGSNKKLIYERRIGSGRLVPREVNWDVKSGSGKQIENENPNLLSNNREKDRHVLAAEIDKLNNHNTISLRYTDQRSQERRNFERRVANSEDFNNGSNNNTNKKFSATNQGEARNNFDATYHLPHFTGQRSMSFRRREYGDQKDHHRNFRDFRESKDFQESRESREQRSDQNHRHNNHRDQKEEPEWFSEGPTSQHDTIELRGFEETDESLQQQEQKFSAQYSKVERNSSESSLISHNSSSTVNLSTKDDFDISREVSNTSNKAKNISDKDNDNGSNCAKEEMTPNTEVNDANESKTDVQPIVPTFEKLKNSYKKSSNVTDFFFDNFLNIEALENSCMPSSNDGGGTSRFSRWFFNNSSNKQSINNDFNKNNSANNEDSKQHSKDVNESDFHSFMSFLKCNNFPTPELPKSLPLNVSALSVEELEARMRKMGSGEIEKTEGSDQNLHKNDKNLVKNPGEAEPDASQQSAEINAQDVEAFQKLLDQLGKPRVDISTVLSNTPGQAPFLTTQVGSYSTEVSPISQYNSLPQSNIAKQECMRKVLHQQQQIMHQSNTGKMVTPLVQHHQPHHRVPQMSPHSHTENMPLRATLHHPHGHNISMIMGQSQKRLDVQHLIQSVLREELSRSFLEMELTNPNIPPYNKEVISAVLNETARYNSTITGSANVSDSLEGLSSNSTEVSTTPNNLMQSLARGEVSLNLLEHELNKLSNGNIDKETNGGGTFRERSLCGTPLSGSSLNAVSIPPSGGPIVPLPPQTVPAQKQNSVLMNDRISSDYQQRQSTSSMLRSNHREDFTLHLPTQRELQMHTQAVQNAMFKKKLEIDHHEVKRRQEIHKHQEIESPTISQQHQQKPSNSNTSAVQQGHQQILRIHSPTPLAFTPTSVLRKMTAEKESICNSAHATTIASSSPQQLQPPLHQSQLKILTHSQIPYQPRMILGGGNFQYMHQQQHQIALTADGSPQISPEQKSHIHNQPPGPPPKWSLIHPAIESNHSVLNSISNKPMGRPILKGPVPIQTLVSQNAHNPIGQNQSNVIQDSHLIQTVSQMQKYPSIQQQPPQIIAHQFSTQLLQHQIPSSQQNSMQQQLFLQQKQRSVVMQRQQIQQNDLGNHAPMPTPIHHLTCNDNNSVSNLNYQRDGGLSPTSNQLAQWFSPELLAQASAGKLPLLNMNQALSLEEFERSIQHSSTAVNNSI